ncbi:MAG: trypsin-like peptidase domain-containing protein [Planctomycetes bacterium]|nr:trypsin-like peptidase domain-containing protein [Planctomycetota bacterium]
MALLRPAVLCVCLVLASPGVPSAWAIAPAESALRATVRVFDAGSSGTGFLVATGDPNDVGKRCLLVTAAHVFENMKSDKGTLVFRLTDREHGIGRKQVLVPTRKGNEVLWTKHPRFDIAVLAVEIPEGVDVKPFEERQIADGKFAEEGRFSVGQDAFIPCFPVQLEANAAGWPILRRGTVATHPLVPVTTVPTFLMDYTSFGGDSGSPIVVWQDNEPMVVGLISGMHRQSEKTVTPNEERTVHSSMGLGIALQSPLIRQTIEDWKKRPSQ